MILYIVWGRQKHCPAILLVECHGNLFKTACLQLEVARRHAHPVGNVCVGAAGECFVLEIFMYFENLVLVSVLGEFHGIIFKVEGNEAELRDEAVFHLVNVRRHEETADGMHEICNLVDRLVNGGGQQARLLIDDVEILVDLHLVAEKVGVVGNVGEVLVEIFLQDVEPLMVRHVAETVGLLLGGDFGTAKHKDVAICGVVLRKATVARGVVVSNGDDIHTAFKGQGDDVVRRHLQVSAWGEQRMGVQVGFIDIHRVRIFRAAKIIKIHRGPFARKQGGAHDESNLLLLGRDGGLPAFHHLVGYHAVLGRDAQEVGALGVSRKVNHCRVVVHVHFVQHSSRSII